MISYSNRYSKIREKLNQNELVILDGGVGTELQKRGIEMDESWCGTASRNTEILKQVHLDYIKAGAQVITTNTYASSRLLLDAAGVGKDFEEINLKAVSAAKAARDEVSDDILIAGSLSHRYPIAHGDMQSNATIQFEQSVLQEATDEMANFLSENGCDLILLEMMYHPDRIQTVFESAKKTNKPIWAGFSTRRTENGDILSLTDSVDVPFREIVEIIKDYELDAVGIMHTDVNIVSDSIKIVREIYDGTILVYPDSGGWVSPNWIFDKVIKPHELKARAAEWAKEGVQILGGCCGLSPEHIQAVAEIKK
ncbi:homocysteine S-methyltransferase family protein [Pelagibacteraceae bacterium]|jgi:homocysteine S-methyltransferase|nr:homocysteine S-methyltransferase family protein [Pelagibacteraceae bacterium]